MFSNRIANSAKFLQMPIDSQLLYFHMVVRADDDGIVESYPITRLLSTTLDNYKILIAKGFIKQLNEDQVVVITDWMEHNKIRADRKVDSVYLPLLKEVAPEIPVLKAKPRSDVKDNSGRISISKREQLVDGPWSAQDKLSKDKLSKDKLDSFAPAVGTQEREPEAPDTSSSKKKKLFEFKGEQYTSDELCEKFVQAINNKLGSRYRVTDLVKKKMHARLVDGYTMEDIMDATRNALQSDFLLGENDNNKRYLTPKYILSIEKLEMWLNSKPQDRKRRY